MKVMNHVAILKNLRNIKEARISSHKLEKLRKSFLDPSWGKAMVLPIDFLKAVTHMPEWGREIETAMYACCQGFPKLKGKTVFVVDVSGSMAAPLSSKSQFNRMDAAAALAVLAAEMSERISVYATAGYDHTRIHKTKWIPPLRGFALSQAIVQAANELGGGGIFTRQCIEFLREKEQDVDRIIVFSDSQDCDSENNKKPSLFGKYNYICDVSSHSHGVNYKGIWTSEITGWSEHMLRYIASCETQPMN